MINKNINAIRYIIVGIISLILGSLLKFFAIANDVMFGNFKIGIFAQYFFIYFGIFTLFLVISRSYFNKIEDERTARAREKAHSIVFISLIFTIMAILAIDQIKPITIGYSTVMMLFLDIQLAVYFVSYYIFFKRGWSEEG